MYANFYPSHQFVFEVDSSSGHLKYADNCLDALALNKVGRETTIPAFI
jgi:hypothetical protein